MNQDSSENEQLFNKYMDGISVFDEIKRLQGCENKYKSLYFKEWMHSHFNFQDDPTKSYFIATLSNEQEFSWMFSVVETKIKVSHEA